MTLILTSSFENTYTVLTGYLPDPKQTTIAFIPTAANVYRDKWFVDEDRNVLAKLGFRIKEIDIDGLDYSQIKNQAKNIDIFFVAGGNTFYLLDCVRKSGFDKFIKEEIEKGATYIGSSAGSVLVCPTTEIARDFDDVNVVPNLTDFSGLNLIDFLILPHYGNQKYLDKMEKVKNEWTSKGYQVRALRDDQALVITGEKEELLTTK